MDKTESNIGGMVNCRYEAEIYNNCFNEIRLYQDALLIWDIEIGIDGNMYCAFRKSTFENLTESCAGFGITIREAIEDLLENELK